jgi:hypothetical protein
MTHDQIQPDMKRAFLIAVIFTGLSSLGFAQSWEQRLKAMEQRVDTRRQAQQERINLAFTNQMRRLWVKTDLKQGLPLPEIPEPSTPKVYDPNLIPKGLDEDRELNAIPHEARTIVLDQPAQAPAAPEPLSPMPDNLQRDVATLEAAAEAEYFGDRFELRYDPRMRVALEGRLTEHRIAEGWERLEQTEYELLLYQLTRQAQNFRLNDWGYAQLVARASRKIIPHDKNARVLLQWFLLSNMGYVATVGYERDHLHLLIPTQQTLYGKTYLSGKGQKLYAIDLEGNDIEVGEARVFSHQYPEATRIMDLRVAEAPRFRPVMRARTISFDYRGQAYRVPMQANRNLVAFYNTYPFVDLSIYLSAPTAEESGRGLVDTLRRVVRQLPVPQGSSREVEAVNFLLHFVQAMPYKTDAEQFGRERYLFADETLYFPYSDCEDRSVLLAYLVHEITGLEVVGLLYPGHAATAVHFPSRVHGDWVSQGGKRYIVADPSYIGADLGETLPTAQTQLARIVRME